MGGRIGSQIKEAGYDVKLIDMWEEHVNTINEKDLKSKQKPILTR